MGRIAEFARAGLTRRLRCSFCGRPEDQVARLVVGASAYICGSCVIKCVAVLDEYGGTAAPGPVT